jgi:hypothetical protein
MAAKAKPRLLTPAGCAVVGRLLADCLKRLNLNTHSAERWIAERVELPEGTRHLSHNTIRGVIQGSHPTFRPETLEILCASGIFDPLTRDEVWAIACECDPKINTGSEDLSLPAQLEKVARNLNAALQGVGEMRARLAIPLNPPSSRSEAIALFQAVLQQNFAGWTADAISDRFQFGDRTLNPDRVQSWLDGRSLPTSAEVLFLGLDGVRLTANGQPLSDRWLDTLSEDWWKSATPPPPVPSENTLADQVG